MFPENERIPADLPDLAGCIDLHTHSLCSDGSMTPRELVNHAAELGLDAIALTDHDTVEGLAGAMAAGKRYNVEVVPGVELSTKADAQVHILGYFIDPKSPVLQSAFRDLQEERRQIHLRYLDLLNAKGFAMTDEEVRAIAPSGGIGRAHYAKIMMDKGYVSSVKEAFDRYLAVGMPCYLERQVMHPVEAIHLIHEAGGVAFFAHPHQTKLPDRELFLFMQELKQAGLDGIEGYYSEYTPRMQDKFLYMANLLQLALSGGSDFHAAMKPHIELGLGMKGMPELRIPYSVLENIKTLAGVCTKAERKSKYRDRGFF